jgi:hypothetical protein
MGKVSWPDGGALLDQPARLVRAFGIIGAEVDHWEKIERRQR